ncbi:rRNA biogenesis protein rrp36 [Exophiala xenobiotica]|uniref:rRNA biogenesis protein RRP36 n=1 Tax=Lithohypha guttulata TaxID=1690604 RepID=A0ABR0JX74_9EURO|nr:rRNA biogenesis protein rrp36 [Lithohypha guttulata]KAK5310453.1 rRNA biogenesis protein rrp36 [Exophiala xenobiotica]
MPPPKPQAIRPRNESEDEALSDNASATGESVRSADEEEQSGGEDESQSSIESGPQSEEENLKDISFGALAEAQARLNPNPRKRKLVEREGSVESEKEFTERDRELRKDIDYTNRGQVKHISRTSKHAPTAMSTRNPVSRKRAIFSPPPADKFRDPRFDASVTADSRRGNTSSTRRVGQNYAFLSDYQAAEVLDLKAQLKKAKDSDQQAQLKRQVMSLEAKLRNAQYQRREAEILQEHKRKEREAIREGKKARPYYLKQSDLKKQIEQERQDAMGKRARDKSDQRKKKREKTKEARDMPRVRRFAD